MGAEFEPQRPHAVHACAVLAYILFYAEACYATVMRYVVFLRKANAVFLRVKCQTFLSSRSHVQFDADPGWLLFTWDSGTLACTRTGAARFCAETPLTLTGSPFLIHTLNAQCSALHVQLQNVHSCTNAKQCVHCCLDKSLTPWVHRRLHPLSLSVIRSFLTEGRILFTYHRC